jgi:hypothetical protein
MPFSIDERSAALIDGSNRGPFGDAAVMCAARPMLE